MLHAVSAKRSSVASDALDWTTSASYAQIRDYNKLVRRFGHRRFQSSQAAAKAYRKAPQQRRTPKRKRVMCACQDGHPASAGDCSGVPSLWIDLKARAVPYGRYVALRFPDSVTRWPLPRVIRGTAGLCRRSLLKILWPLIIQTAFQCSWRKWWRLDSHQRRRSGPCQYQ